MEMDGGAFATVTLNNLVAGGQFLQEVLVVGAKGMGRKQCRCPMGCVTFR